MAKRNREAALKRARERARQEKKEAKRERQAAKQTEDSAEPVNEQALMEEFARLSERYEAGQINSDDYDRERHRIFVDLGIEEDPNLGG